MEIRSNKEEMIFRNERDGKVSYSIGLSKEKEDGTYEKGYMAIKFRKGTELKDKTKIKIQEAWVDFFKVEKKTIPYIFINKFELASDVEAMKQVQEPKEKTYLEQQQMKYVVDDDLPFY